MWLINFAEFSFEGEFCNGDGQMWRHWEVSRIGYLIESIKNYGKKKAKGLKLSRMFRANDL